jgi:hypothetical protein
MAERQSDTSVDPADRVSWGSRFVAGIADGILSAVLMMGFMMAYSSATGAGVTMPLKALGALVYGVEALVAGSMAMLAGAGIQLGFSIVLGILFALMPMAYFIAHLLFGIGLGLTPVFVRTFSRKRRDQRRMERPAEALPI